MKRLVWTCDRCATTFERNRKVVMDSEYGLWEDTRDWDRRAPGWEELHDEEAGTITDVCPSCLTDGEHVDRVIREVEGEVIFGDGGAA